MTAPVITRISFVCCLLASLQGFTQEKVSKSAHAMQSIVKYIGSSENEGQSEAVIVDEVPLAHTRQFLPLDNNGRLVAAGDFSKQFGQAFLNISNALKTAESGIDRIIKVNVFLKDVSHIPETQTLLSQKFLKGRKPAVTFVAGELAQPEALIAIDVVAVSGMTSHAEVILPKSSIRGKKASVAVLPKGPVVYVSGQAAKGGLAEATRETLRQLEETLISMGLTKQNIVQVKSFLNPMSSLSVVEKEFADFFGENTLPPLVFTDWISSDPVIEIELIAASPSRNGTFSQVEYLTPPGMSASPVYSKMSRLNFGKKIYISGMAGKPSGSSDAELTEIFNSLGDRLKSGGSDFNHLLKGTYYILNEKYSKSLGDIRPKYYDPQRPPAASKATVKGVGVNASGISIDMIGTVPISNLK